MVQSRKGGSVQQMVELGERYVAAWNSHDPAAVAAMFVEGGTYEDPMTDGPVAGEGIAEAADRLFQALPDVCFEIEGLLPGDGVAGIQWVMRGTSSGPFSGAPPTGETVALAGASFLRTEDGILASAVGYFDQRGLATQMGHQAPVIPRRAGPMRFGTSARLDTGSRARPGAISLTRIDVGSPAGLVWLRDSARPVLRGMAGMASLIGAAIFNDGQNVGYTVSAWPSPEAASDIMGQEEHRASVRAFFSDGPVVSGWTSVWAPVRLNTLWVRCPACGTMADAEAGEACTCGAALPERPPFF